MSQPRLPGSEGFAVSPSLWGMFPLDEILAGDRRLGFGMYDDFTDFGGALSTNDGQYWSEGNRYLSYQTASTFIVPTALTGTPATVAPTNTGAITFSPTAGVADNDIMSLQWGGQLATPYGSYPFAVVPGISKDLIFECRFKVSSIAASIGDFFIGLAGAAGVQLMTAVLPITDADALTTTHSLLGFSRLGANTSQCYLTYERSGGTVSRTRNTNTMVADTYIKAGFRYSGKDHDLRTFIDGVEVASVHLAPSVTGATPWPNDYMTPICCVKQIDGTTALTLTLDWWACAQAV